MDSGPVTSDSATDTAPTARPHFGPRLAARVRPRARVARQISQRSTIGVVARSSMGFGLAIGMSQGSRPMVTPDTSTSTRLRPPVPIWRRHDDEPAPDPTPSWAERITRASRPGRTSAGPTVRRSTKTVPAQAEFVSSGDRKLDALRRLLQAGPADDQPVRNPNAAPATINNNPAIRRSAAPAASPTTAVAAVAPERVIGRRGDTMSGPGTAPGEIGRRFQPETIQSSDIKAVLPDAPVSTRGSKSPGRAPASLDRNTDRSTDAFERMLRSRGLIAAAPADDATTPTMTTQVGHDHRHRPTGRRAATPGPQRRVRLVSDPLGRRPHPPLLRFADRPAVAIRLVGPPSRHDPRSNPTPPSPSGRPVRPQRVCCKPHPSRHAPSTKGRHPIQPWMWIGHNWSSANRSQRQRVRSRSPSRCRRSNRSGRPVAPTSGSPNRSTVSKTRLPHPPAA